MKNARSPLWNPTRWFEDFFRRDWAQSATHRQALKAEMEIEEAAQEFHIQIDLPGIRKENIQVQTAKDELTLLVHDGKLCDTYERHIRLPEGADLSRVETSFDHGILNIHIPKVKKSIAPFSSATTSSLN